MKQYKSIYGNYLSPLLSGIEVTYKYPKYNVEFLENNIWLKLSADDYYAINGDKFYLQLCIEKMLKK